MKIYFLFLFWLAAIAMPAVARTPGEIEVGGTLREATLNGLSGNSRKFSDYRGRPLIINIWASWCSPCRTEMSSLDRLSRRFGGKQFNVIGISTDDNGKAAAAFIKWSMISFENYLDSNVLLENMLGANAIPLTILVDAQGRVLRKVRGSHEWDSPEYLQLIADTFRIKLT